MAFASTRLAEKRPVGVCTVRNSSAIVKGLATSGTSLWKAVEKSPVPRRTLLQLLATAVAATPLGRLAIFAQAPAAITDAQTATLKAIAEVVLPSAISSDERDRIVTAFVARAHNYREGAEMGHGYGSSTLRQPSGPSPAARYPAQFAALDESARASGTASFAVLSIDARRSAVETALNGPQPVNRLPAQPNGQNLIADFMCFYFTSADAWDLAYEAQIGRDRCRTLDGSDLAPEPLGRSRR
jgi:hypothetical protein